DNGQMLSPETRVDNRKSDWCTETCTRFQDCPAPSCDCSDPSCACRDFPGVQQCASDCQAYVNQVFIGHGDACARAGERIMDCYSAASCSDLTSGNPCPLSADEQASCQLQSDPTASPTGPNGAAGPVTCQVGDGGGSAPGASSFQCETN